MKKSSSGQSFFEVVVALAVVSIVLITLVALATVSIRNASFSRNKTLATRMTQDTLEWLRSERNVSWNSFTEKAGTLNSPISWCVSADPPDWPTSFGICSANEFVDGTIFKREVKMTNLDVNTVEVEVKTSWIDSQGVHESKSVTDLTKWQ